MFSNKPTQVQIDLAITIAEGAYLAWKGKGDLDALIMQDFLHRLKTLLPHVNTEEFNENVTHDDSQPIVRNVDGAPTF